MHKTAKHVLDEYERGERNFQGLNLDGENFGGHDLSGSDFSKSSLLSTNFKSAKLDGCNFSGIKAGLKKKWLFFLALVAILSHIALGIFASLTGYILIYFFLPSSFNLTIGYIAVTLFAIAFVVIQRFGVVASVGVGVGAIIAVGSFVLLLPGILGLHRGFQICLRVLSAAITTAFIFKLKQNIYVEIDSIYLRWIVISLLILIPIYFYRKSIEGIAAFSWTNIQAKDFISRFGANFKRASIQNANFSNSDIKFSNFIYCKVDGSRWLNAKGIKSTAFLGHYLQHSNIQDLLTTGIGRKCLFTGMNLAGINLEGFDLSDSNFTQTILDRAVLVGTDLSNCLLSQTQLNDSNLSDAILTGACIEGWGVSEKTKFKNVKCDHVFRIFNTQEKSFSGRLPVNPKKTFSFNEFENWMRVRQGYLDTIDITFNDDIAWQAFFKSLEKVRRQNPEADIRMQSVQEVNGTYVVSLRLENEIHSDSLGNLGALIEDKIRDSFETEMKASREENLVGKIEKTEETQLTIEKILKIGTNQIIQNFYGPVGNVARDNYGSMNVNQVRTSQDSP